MAYNYTFNAPISDGSGPRGLTLPQPVAFGEIFDGTPQFYIGSAIEVQEILTITSEVVIGQEALVDVDFKWFQPKVYFGTYQLTAIAGGIEDENSGGQGFLTNQFQKFIRRSTYQIVADPDTPLAYQDTFVVDNCSFQTKEISAFFGGVSIALATPVQNESLFTGKISRTRAPLKDTIYNSFFTSVGLYYNPGCALNSVNHKIQVINVVSTDLDAYPDFSCALLGG